MFVYWFCSLTQSGQVFLLLLLIAVSIDRVHNQRGLHTHDRAIATVHSLHLTRDETVRHITCARAAVALIGKCAWVKELQKHTEHFKQAISSALNGIN